MTEITRASVNEADLGAKLAIQMWENHSVEGVFVEAAYRRQGIAGELVRACQGFAKEQGCTEFASEILYSFVC